MRRGELWTVAGGKDYAGKPRPAVILQDDRFDMTDSITVCAFTTDPTDAPLFRLPVEPNAVSDSCRKHRDPSGEKWILETHPYITTAFFLTQDATVH